MERRSGLAFLAMWPVGWALLMIGPDLVRRSMYNDGLWYASIARNMAEGRGSLWFPSLSETIQPRFHEHPPLGFWIQSIWFRLLGDSPATERLYGLAILILTILVMAWIWRQVRGASSPMQAGIVLAVWIWLLNEITYRVAPSNLLEPTMSLLDLVAAGLLLQGERSRWWALPAAAAFILAAILVKGPTALYPLALPAVAWLTGQSHGFREMVARTLSLLLLVTLGLGAILLFAEARDSLLTYVHQQLWSSITSVRTEYHHRASRFWILGRLVITHLPALAMLLLIRISHLKTWARTADRSWLFLIAMGLVASLPLIISPKQADYYLFPSLPWFALGMARWAGTNWQEMVANLTGNRSVKVGFVAAGIMLCLAGVIRTVGAWDKVVGRDQDVWHDVRLICDLAGEDTTISLWMPGDSLQNKLALNSHLIGYLQREARIHVDTVNRHWPVHIRWHKDEEPVPDFLVPLDAPAIRYPLYHRHIKNPQD